MLRTVHLKKSRAFPLIVTFTLLLSLAVTAFVDNAVPLNAHAATHATCESPPAGFDPTASTVTNATLVQYGYPPRPSSSTSSSSYKAWLTIVKNVKHHVCTTSTTKGSTRAATASRQSQTMMPLTFNATKYYNSFAGYVGYSTSLSIFTATWVVPCPQSGGSVTDGLTLLYGGDNSQAIAIGTTEAHDTSTNTDTDQFVAQAGSGTVSLADSSSNPIHCGDTASASITYDATGPLWTGWVSDNTTQTAYTLSVSATGASVGSEFSGESGGSFSTPSSTNPLLHFAPIAWSGVTIDPGTGNETTLSNYSPTLGQMNNASGSGLAYPGNLDSTGAGFTDTWYNAY